LEELLEVTWEGCFLLVIKVEVIVSFDTIFSYDMVSRTCGKFWCIIQLLWALVGVAPLDSALIADNVGLVTSNYFSGSQSHLVVSIAACLDVHLFDGTYLLLAYVSYELRTFC
jgi:uncharacterized membrane protein YuzA (DUF378 family)